MIALALPLLLLAGPVTPIGTFDTYHIGDGPLHGYGVQLWRLDDELFGQFSASNDEARTTPNAFIEFGHYAPGPDGVSFTTMEMVTGSHSCPDHPYVPARKRFTFRGELDDSRLSGTLEAADLVHPEATTRSSIVLPLRKERMPLPTYPSREAWQDAVRQSLRNRLPGQ